MDYRLGDADTVTLPNVDLVCPKIYIDTNRNVVLKVKSVREQVLKGDR